MKSRIPLDYEIATAIALDAGNSSMHKANRKSWNSVDWNVAYRQFSVLRDWNPLSEKRLKRIENHTNGTHKKTGG